MDVKTTIIFVLVLFSLAAMVMGVITDQSVNAAESEPETVSPAPEVRASVTQTPVHTHYVKESDVEVRQPKRYDILEISDEEKEEMARIVWLESRGESAEGQQAVAEVILNRAINKAFPDTVHDVIHEGEDSGTVQFDTVYYLQRAEPTYDQYAAVSRALDGPWVLEPDVVFFSADGENSRVYKVIGGHTFCREYLWEN
jgi:spore germination cell wall hydrolase CwlJ-like protein